jgi:hypothetical protein
MSDIVFKRKEGKWIVFTVTKNSVAVDLTTTICSFVVKEDLDDIVYVIEKTDGDFDKSQAANGIIRVNISTTDSDITEKIYYSELKIIFTSGVNEDLSETLSFEIERAVHN